jgi:hypothetical protein
MDGFEKRVLNFIYEIHKIKLQNNGEVLQEMVTKAWFFKTTSLNGNVEMECYRLKKYLGNIFIKIFYSQIFEN